MAEKRQYHITPAGTAQYPRLNKPDTAFGNVDGIYKITLVLPGAEAQPLIELIDKEMGESLIKARRENPTKAKTIKPASDKPYKAVTDDEGNGTGEYKFNFKMKAKITKKDGTSYEQRPAVFDAKLRPIPVTVNVGGGSVVKVKFENYQFYTALVGAGVSLRLLAVQVLDLVEYSRSGAEGFEAGDGYEAEDTTSDIETTPHRIPDADLAALAKADDDEVPF